MKFGRRGRPESRLRLRDGSTEPTELQRPASDSSESTRCRGVFVSITKALRPREVSPSMTSSSRGGRGCPLIKSDGVAGSALGLADLDAVRTGDFFGRRPRTGAGEVIKADS